MKIELPTIEDAEHRVETEHADPLDEFIARWEPKLDLNKKVWRKDLRKMLEWYENE